METSDVTRHKALDHENNRLMRRYAEFSLENAMPKNSIAKKRYGLTLVQNKF
jgi:hypothetical protein